MNYRLKVSSSIHYLLLIIGLTSEFFVVRSIIRSKFGHDGFITIIVFLAIIIMLIHQFMIIRNFHILDRMEDTESKSKDTKSKSEDTEFKSEDKEFKSIGVGDWILKSRIEDILRVILFVLFACLTGEITYLAIVSEKTTNFGFIETNGTFYNLNWISSFYIHSATILALIMFIWDITGACYDKKLKTNFGFSKISENKKLKIVSFPFKNPYHTFLASDLLGLIFWILLWLMVIFNIDTSLWFVLMFMAYGVLIFVRFIGEIIIQSKKMKENLKSYWEKTQW